MQNTAPYRPQYEWTEPTFYSVIGAVIITSLNLLLISDAHLKLNAP